MVEDGSSVPCKEVVKHYADCLDIHYYNKPNSGPGQTRNYGAERSNGEYLIVLDSDCILPEGYLAAVGAELQRERADAFGGPDRAHESFSDVQKAINYAMTSFFTTGGIRGGKKTSSIRAVSIWECARKYIKLWVVSLKCVLERILISVSEYLREAMSVGCFPRRGYGTNAVRT